jgi:hypothetical protein
MPCDPAMTHESRLGRELRSLLQEQRVAALGSLCEDGTPMVTVVPFAPAAIEPGQGCVVVHLSGLAAHTANLLDRPAVSLLVMRPEVPGQAVHALPRVTLQGRARLLAPDGAAWTAGRAAYLRRFPEAEMMTALGDFRFFAIAISQARQVAGFGAARSIAAEDLAQVLTAAA